MTKRIREYRAIDIDPLPLTPPVAPPVGWRRVTQQAHGTEERWREGGALHIRIHTCVVSETKHGRRTSTNDTYIVEPGVVDYAEIFEATEVVTDDHHTEAPWETCDGFEHTDVHDLELVDAAARGWWGMENERGFIILNNPEEWGVYDYHRASGASKQVAREIEACNNRRTLDLLVKWYSEGWWWYGVKCNFQGYNASVWGIDDEDYAGKYVRVEIADEVAYQMTEDGYKINRPPGEQEDKRVVRRCEYRKQLQRQLHSFDWNDDALQP